MRARIQWIVALTLAASFLVLTGCGAKEEKPLTAAQKQRRVRLLTSELSDQHFAVRTKSAKALAEMGIEARPAIAELTKSLGDEYYGVRAWAAAALAAIGPDARSAASALAKAASDERREVRLAAIRAMGVIGETSDDVVLALARRRATDEREDVREVALAVLLSFGTLALPGLREAARRHPNPEVRQAVADVLREIAPE